MKKIAFFDVDGTLCNSSGEVLPSTISAIREFRKNGNFAYICTGRSKPEILDSLLEVGFDGIIGAGGGYIVIEDEVISHSTMPKQLVVDLIAYFNEHDIGYYLETNDGLFASDNLVRKIQEELKKKCAQDKLSYEHENEKAKWFFNLIKPLDGAEIEYGNVNKISFINNTVPFTKIEEQFGQLSQMHRSTVAAFGKESGEISIKGVDKKTAIEFVLKELGLEKKDAIAFGDGDNDIAMFNAVGYKIAMGNATENLKDIADEITLTSEAEGIAISLEKMNWLN